MTSNTKSTPVETVDMVALANQFRADYMVADAKGKAAIRTLVRGAQDRAVDELDIEAAKAARDLLASLSPATPTPTPVDWTGRVVARVATLRLAADLLESGTIRPDGLGDVDWDTVATVTRPGSENVSEAVKLAAQAVGRTGTRSDVAAAIVGAFSGLPKGTVLTCSEIANKMHLPSSGAVAARLFPREGACTVEGVVPVDATATKGRGARLA